MARAAGLPVPEIVFVELDAELARTEPDPEIQDLITRAAPASTSALDYLPGSVTFDPLAFAPDADARLAHRLVRRLRHQRRPHGAQHQPAGLAQASCG